MKRVCAWCNKELEPNEKYAHEGGITHGICSLCALKISEFERRTVRQMLSYIQEPVFVVDPEGRVQAANKNALKLLGKKEEDIDGALGGDAFECAYSQEEGGCGQTIHCKTCTMRRSITYTLQTGETLENVEAYQDCTTENEATTIRFLISTEKVGEAVLLRVMDNTTPDTVA